MNTDGNRVLKPSPAPSDAVVEEVAAKVKLATLAKIRPRRRKFRLGLASILAGGTVMLGVGVAGGAIATNLTNSQADAVSASVTCLESRGWDPTVHADGVSLEGPPEVVGAFSKDAKECAELVGPNARKPTREELASVYESQLNVRSCLIRNGVDLPKALAIDEYLSGGGAWSPYLDIDEVTFAERFEELEEACPQASLW